MIYVLLIGLVVQAILFAFLASRLRALERKEGARPSALEPAARYVSLRRAAVPLAGVILILSLGTWAIAQNLEVHGKVTAGTVDPSDHSFMGKVGIGISSPAEALDVNGNVRATAFYYSSDGRLKKDVEPISGLEKILKLRGVRFTWENNGNPDIGMVAQEVEAVYPELVMTNPDTGLKSMKYGTLVAPLIEAVKEQQRQIESQNTKIERLERNFELLRSGTKE